MVARAMNRACRCGKTRILVNREYRSIAVSSTPWWPWPMIVSISQCPGALQVSTAGGRWSISIRFGILLLLASLGNRCDIFDLGEVDTYRGFHRGVDPDVPVRTAMRDF